MPTFREYRVILPVSLEEYRIAQLYMVAKYSAGESSSEDSADGVEILKNEPYEDENRKGQFTHKIYHLASKLPAWLVAIIPRKALMLEERAWNSYPYCMTVLTSPYFTKLKLQIETMHVAGDRASVQNALNCDKDTLSKRIVEQINIGQDPVENYIPEEDPSKFKSKKTGRGPLLPGWMETCDPVMTAYKFVTVDVPYWGFGAKVENYISKNVQRRVQTEGFRKAFCWIDEWFGMTMADIREMEKEVYEKLNQARKEKLMKLNGKKDSVGNLQELEKMAEEASQRSTHVSMG